MDLTALELGLRNRQLLQVKCFLKIQVETFRYFLTEELPRLKNCEERISSLDKFFTHDWQNVINKIVSVAVVNMTGDYVSMMLAVSLFRSVIQACNQLLLIIASISQTDLDLFFSQMSDEPNKFVMGRSYSSTSSQDSQLQPDSTTIKERIFFILQRQIRSINSHLERIYSVNIGSDQNSNLDFSYHPRMSKNVSSLQTLQFSKQEELVSTLSLSDIDELAQAKSVSTVVDVVFQSFHANREETFQKSIEKTTDKIALLQYIAKKYITQTGNVVEQHSWNSVMQNVIKFVSQQLRDNEISLDLIERICTILSQTGLSSLYLLFSIFIQTYDSKLRQKLLQVFFIKYNQISQFEIAIEHELNQNNTKHFDQYYKKITESKFVFAKYLQIISIIDLYTFCYRPQLIETEHLETSIEWILNSEQSEFSLIKSFILPSLDEIFIHPELFTNWQTLNEQIYSDTWQHVCDHFIQKQDFVQMVSSEVLWQYWVDNNRVQSIVDWIEKGFTSLPYCPKIEVSNDFDWCQRMVCYLREKGSFLLQQKVIQSLFLKKTFFGQYNLYQLDPEFYQFQTILGQIGQCDFLFETMTNETNEDHPILISHFLRGDKLSCNAYFQLSLLVEYCLDKELYEFLYLIFNKFTLQMEPVILDLLDSGKLLSSRNKSILQLLLFFDSTSRNSENSENGEFISYKSLLVMKYLHASENDAFVDVSNDKEDFITLIAHRLIEKQQDIDLALLLLSFSKRTTFDQLANYVHETSQNKFDLSFNLSTTFYKLLNSKYALICKAFESAFHENQCNFALLPSLSSTPEYHENTDSSRSKNTAFDSIANFLPLPLIDLYSLLQQGIPYVNIDKFFKWQIKRRVQRLRQNSALDDTNDSIDLQARTRKISTTVLSCENHELPNFSQNRLSELYGLKAELTSSYYLKNSRLLESFFKCFNFKPSSKSTRVRDNLINQKLATKAIRKAALIAYGSLRQNSVFACCLLFQSLVKGNLSSSNKSENGIKRSFSLDASMVSAHQIGSEINTDLEKTRLHLSIGKLIIEYVPDSLTVQSAQQQQSALSVLLRKSHFNGDRSSSQKLLDLAVMAIERKNSYSNKDSAHSTLNKRLHSLLLTSLSEGNLHLSPVNDNDNGDEYKMHTLIPVECSLLMECFDWKPLLMFADMYSLKRPFNFLIKCAREDNWLVFSIFAQMYTISKDNIQTLLRNGIFNNQCIGEHLAKAFQSSHRLNGTDSKLMKMKQAPSSSRNDFYSRLFKGKVSSHSPESLRVNTNLPLDPFESDLLSPNSSPETFSLGSMSMLSKLSDEAGTAPLVLYENVLKPETTSKDFLQLVLEIYQNCTYFGARTNSISYSFENTFRSSLLYAAVSLSNPVLALLACSLDRPPLTPVIDIKSPPDSLHSRSESIDLLVNPNSVSSQFKFTSFMCWLLSSVNFQTKQLFIDSCIHSNGQSKKADLTFCYLNWTCERSLHLIDVLTKQDSHVFVIILEGLAIFELEIPILQKLLQFLTWFFIEKDYYQSDNILKEFKSLLQSYNEDEFLLSRGVPPLDYENFETEEDNFISNQGSLRIFYSKNWIERCCLILVTNSLLLARQFELGILLSHYNFVRLKESFAPNHLPIPDIRNLYLFSQCLAKLPNFTLPIDELLRHGSTLSDNGNLNSADYVDIFRKLIFDLQEAGHFEEARNIINMLPKANVNEFIINEWMLKAKKMNNSIESNYFGNEDVILNQIDLTFWENCWAQVTKLDPSMHSAFKVMERFVQHLQPNQMLIKCFVLLKCMLAIESILRDFIETNSNDSPDTKQNTFFDDLSTSNLDLVQDYFQFEYSLWSSAVECEYLILNKKCQYDKNGEVIADLDSIERSTIYTEQDNIVNAWKLIWRDIVNYTKSSSFSNYIIPKLSLKHTFFYKNINSKRNKAVVNLDISRQQSLNLVIGKLLDSLCLQKAKEVSTLFSYSHDDFQIIQASDNAANGTLQNITDAPFAVQFKIQNFDSTGSSKFSNSFSLFSSQNLSPEQKQTISLIETISHFASIGKKFCNLILLYYKISCILHVSYSELMNSSFSSLKVFQQLLTSNQFDNKELRHRANSSETSELNYSYETPSQSESMNDDVEFDIRVESSISQPFVINQYMEAIACAKDLIKIVGEQDEQLNSEEKIASHLASYTLSNVQQLVDRQFKDIMHSGSDSTQVVTLVTEIELDKSHLAFYSARFLVMIKLLHEPSILGHALIDISKKQKNNLDFILERSPDSKTREVNFLPSLLSNELQSEMDYVLIKRKHYVLLVELYIRAHECFSAQCDVHGIAIVLRRTRLLITQELQPARYFHLILRLLTGIGRYSEMTYCFDLFRECDRFELVLSKRVQRTPQLRIALLNYLKTTDKVDELLPLVAIRFFLFRETAEYHRTRAERLLNEVCAHQLPSTLSQSHFNKLNTSVSSSPSKRISSTSLTEYASHSPTSTISSANNVNLVYMREQLETILYEFQEAESNFTKASSHTNADYCSRKSQLIALQITYINQVVHSNDSFTATSGNSVSSSTHASVPMIINMDTNQVREYIYQCNRFFEALIVSKAYLDVNIDWTDSVFHNVLLNGNMAYLNDFAEIFPVSMTFLKSLVKRYDQLCSAFKQQSKLSSRDLYHLGYQSMTNSPSSASFNNLLSLIRSDNEINKIHRLLEQLLERVLCFYSENQSSTSPVLNVPMANCNIKDKYELATQFNSPRIIQRLMEADIENSAYLLDLKHVKKL